MVGVNTLAHIGTFLAGLRYNKYYSISTGRFVRTVTGCVAWIGAVEFLVHATRGFNASILGGVILCCILLGLWLTNAGEDLEAISLASKRNPAWELSEDRLLTALIAIIGVQRESIKADVSNDYIISSYLQVHADHCINPICFSRILKDSGMLSLSKNRTETLGALQYTINRKFKEILMKSPGLVAVRLIYIGFLIHHVRNYILAWEINEGTRGYKTNAVQRFQLHCYKFA
ncbi:MAG: hypothetical protein P4M11_11090 [Candidatus Pacebacteria bacterium]|nr:hypothetical protein [Candidatus Paceibacterota bacterium]